MVGPRRRGPAFTIVELLVVIAIIAVLMSVLVPTLSKAREAARAAQCMSNLRQLGQGFHLYADANHDFLAIAGPDGSGAGSGKVIGRKNALDRSVPAGIDDMVLWYNAVSSTIFKRSYYDFVAEDKRVPTDPTAKKLATTGDNNIFICPSANAPFSQIPSEISPDGGYFYLWGSDSTTKTPAQFKFNISYGINSALFTVTNTGKAYLSWRMSGLTPGSSVVLLVEKLSFPGEYKAPAQGGTDVNAKGYKKNIGQPKANWKRLTTRHHGGGNLLFADGHVAWWGWADVNNFPINPYNPGLIDGNQPNKGLIWNPLAGVGTKFDPNDN